MFRHIPNVLTASRLLLAAVFFALLSLYQDHSSAGSHPELVWLNLAFIVYLIALFTDFLDGYLARLWKVEGAFGRVVDPFVDKVLVLGSFIFFAGKNFTIQANDPAPLHVLTITGVEPWMVVVILARELLVTTLRGSMESTGQAFGAVLSGKLKMVFQSVTILVILVYVNYRQWLIRTGIEPQAKFFRNFCIAATVIITVISGFMYVGRAVSLYRRGIAEKRNAGILATTRLSSSKSDEPR